MDHVSLASPAIEVGVCLTRERVRGAPERVAVDNGPKFVSRALDAWAPRHGVRLGSSRPGKPTDNAFAESFNGRFRDECLDCRWFASLEEERRTIEAWRIEDNAERPHRAPRQQTPAAWEATDTIRRGAGLTLRVGHFGGHVTP